MGTSTIYARISPEVRSALDTFITDNGCTLAAAVNSLLGMALQITPGPGANVDRCAVCMAVSTDVPNTAAVTTVAGTLVCARHSARMMNLEYEGSDWGRV